MFELKEKLTFININQDYLRQLHECCDDDKENRVLVKEAMGCHKFPGDNIYYQWYKIDSERDTFYKRGTNKEVKSIPDFVED